MSEDRAPRWLVLVEQDWNFWTVEFTSRSRTACCLVKWWRSRTPDGEWWSRNVRLERRGAEP